jgi:hypothetical protein
MKLRHSLMSRRGALIERPKRFVSAALLTTGLLLGCGDSTVGAEVRGPQSTNPVKACEETVVQSPGARLVMEKLHSQIASHMSELRDEMGAEDLENMSVTLSMTATEQGGVVIDQARVRCGDQICREGETILQITDVDTRGVQVPSHGNSCSWDMDTIIESHET